MRNTGNCRHCGREMIRAVVARHEIACLADPDIVDLCVETWERVCTELDHIDALVPRLWNKHAQDVGAPTYTTVKAEFGEAWIYGMLGIDTDPLHRQCPHCGDMKPRKGALVHIKACMSNPDKFDLVVDALVQALENSDTPLVTSQQYDEFAAENGAHRHHGLMSHFGSWDDFLFSFGLEDEWKSLGQFETYGDMIAAGADDRSLFVEMARRRHELGIGNL